jgi:hypothetical protein
VGSFVSAAQLLADNVIPVDRKVSTVSSAAATQAFQFSLAKLQLIHAAGGFNSVVELSSDACLRTVHLGLKPSYFVTSLSVAQLRDIASQASFESFYLNRLIEDRAASGTVPLVAVLQPLSP